MPSHNTVLDVPCHANDWLVNKVGMSHFTRIAVLLVLHKADTVSSSWLDISSSGVGVSG
jgi:hypothetical protein